MSGERKKYTQADLIPGMRDEKGLVCQHCGCRHFFVHWTKQHNNYIERKRVCRHCGRWMLTREENKTGV
jgi:ribosomal protein L33